VFKFRHHSDSSLEMLRHIITLIFFNCSHQALSKLVSTPFGKRHEDCVLEVPEGSVTSEENGRLKVSHPLLGETWHEVPAICHDEQYQPAKRAAPRTPAWGAKCDLDDTPKECQCDSPPCTCSALPCNSWIDNAGFWTHPQAIGGFSSVYTVPQTPQSSGPGQCLFWFIGTENTDGLPRHGQPVGGRTILQPVLTYNPDGWCKNSKSGWCFSSWNCCPANVTTHSPYINNVQPGEKYLGYFNLTKEGTYEVGSQNVKTGEKTTLQAAGNGRIFNWADITLEVYDLTSCDLFATGPMTFGEIKVWDTTMRPIKTDKWLLTSTKPCKGTVTQVDAQTITVEHSATGHDELVV